jgi:23S rRNA pseudouridine955/2504/2580 synthase
LGFIACVSSMPESTKPGASYQSVDAEFEGQRLDNFLLARLKGVPRSLVYRLVRSGQVRVNSGRVAPSYRIRAGDRVRIPPVSRSADVAPVRASGSLAWLEQRIVFEDERLIVVDKPAGLAVHGGSGIQFGCIEALRQLRPELKALELIHRLDRETSGCLLVAKRRSALRSLHGLMREQSIHKRYVALVQGYWPRRVRTVEAPLTTQRVSGEARVRVDSAGKEARSHFQPLRRYGKFATLVSVAIETGRTHQIRVHAAHSGCAVAGDERYGSASFALELQALRLHRMFLHASEIGFVWPDTGQPFGLCVPLPPELASVITALEERFPSHAET